VELHPGADWSLMGMTARLTLRGITRRYGRVTALDGASLEVAAGRVHAVLGENGAGKSTLMKIAFGLERPDSGTMVLNGAAVSFRTPSDAIARGIGMVQQHFALVPAMTVAENVALGGRGSFSRIAARAVVERVCRESGLALDPDALVRDLPVSAQQRLEIVKALARDVSLLILDEPTAVLAPAEVDELFTWVRQFVARGGTVVLIAHKLREVLRVADDITVLRDGRTVLTTSALEATESALALAMLGSDHADASGAPTPRSTVAVRDDAPVVLSLRDVTVHDARGVPVLRDASLDVRSGELVGVAAVEGAGQYELLRVLAGRVAVVRGVVTRPETVGFVPEDRQRDAVLLDGTLVENLALRGLGARRGVMPWSALATETATLLRERDVRAPGGETRMRSLSGGNQQKLVLGRELASGSAALVLENPTRGLDIRATAEVHTAIRSARRAGAAVVLYSSDLDEVLSLADRVVVVSNGQVVTASGDRDAVGRAMLGAA
jgi:general nucleoside transport system ATP-binding protein